MLCLCLQHATLAVQEGVSTLSQQQAECFSPSDCCAACQHQSLPTAHHLSVRTQTLSDEASASFGEALEAVMSMACGITISCGAVRQQHAG